jgi:F-type H+-transporting ATPase subunit b
MLDFINSSIASVGPAEWVAIAFIIFVVLIFKFIKKTVVVALDSRQGRIRNELDEAVRLKEEAQAILVSYKDKQREAMQEADRIIKTAESDAKTMINNATKELEQSLDRRVLLVEQKIVGYEKTVLNEIKDHAIDIAVTAVSQVIEKNMDKKLSDKLVTQSIAAIEIKLN